MTQTKQINWNTDGAIKCVICGCPAETNSATSKGRIPACLADANKVWRNLKNISKVNGTWVYSKPTSIRGVSVILSSLEQTK